MSDTVSSIFFRRALPPRPPSNSSAISGATLGTVRGLVVGLARLVHELRRLIERRAGRLADDIPAGRILSAGLIFLLATSGHYFTSVNSASTAGVGDAFWRCASANTVAF